MNLTYSIFIGLIVVIALVPFVIGAIRDAKQSMRELDKKRHKAKSVSKEEPEYYVSKEGQL